MVTISQPQPSQLRKQYWSLFFKGTVAILLLFFAAVLYYTTLLFSPTSINSQHDIVISPSTTNINTNRNLLRPPPLKEQQSNDETVVTNSLKSNHNGVNLTKNVMSHQKKNEEKTTSSLCPYKKLDDLTDAERFPSKGGRHMIDPPSGGKLTLVCCQTTKGPWSIVVHSKWAPLGAERFLQMVNSNTYFKKTNLSLGVPLMRCIKNFLCQFGLNGNVRETKKYDDSLQDDPNWLPEGPDHRTNADGVKRFAQGYLAYAGSGKNSRSNQFIVSLQSQPRLAGGSPWEVPWGELVGSHSFTTLSKIYTGYGEKGPSQGKLRNQGTSPEVQSNFPLLDYITSCKVVDASEENNAW